MNLWEKKHKYTMDSVSAMIAYAESINPDHDSSEFAEALYYWAKNLSDDYERQWQKDNADL